MGKVQGTVRKTVAKDTLRITDWPSSSKITWVRSTVQRAFRRITVCKEPAQPLLTPDELLRSCWKRSHSPRGVGRVTQVTNQRWAVSIRVISGKLAMATMDVQAALNMEGMINDPNIERKGILSAVRSRSILNYDYVNLSVSLAATWANIPESMPLLRSSADDHWQALISHPNPREMVLISKEKDDALFRSFKCEFSTMEVGPSVALKIYARLALSHVH